MTRAVLPKPAAAARWMVAGQADGVPSSDRRAAPLLGETDDDEHEENDAFEEPSGESVENVAMECLEAEDADVPRPDAADGDEAARAERWSDDVDM